MTANSFETLVRWLESEMSSADSVEDAKACAAVGEQLPRFVGADAGSSLLRDYVAFAKASSPGTGGSYRHANGFDKLSLYRASSDAFKIRLHIWWNGAQDSAIHNHRWNLASCILRGRMYLRNYGVRAYDDHRPVMWRHEYSDLVSGSTKSVKCLDRCSLDIEAGYLLSSGGSHSLHYSTPHLATTPEHEVTASLVVTTKPAKEYSHAFLPEIRMSGHSREHNLYKKEDVYSLVSALVEHVA